MEYLVAAWREARDREVAPTQFRSPFARLLPWLEAKLGGLPTQPKQFRGPRARRPRCHGASVRGPTLRTNGRGSRARQVCQP